MSAALRHEVSNVSGADSSDAESERLRFGRGIAWSVTMTVTLPLGRVAC